MRRTLLIVAGFALLAVGGAACGSAGADDPTPVQTWKITPASGSPAAAAPTAPAETPESAADATPGTGTTVAIAGVSSAFDVEEIEAPAGAITVEFDNRDGGIPHNIHFFRGGDARGESIGETELEVGPVQQTLTLAPDPGEYFYQCDAHPTTMSGTLTVVE